MIIHIAHAVSLIESLALALLLRIWADRVAGASLLVVFLCGVAVWVAGNELPTWFGPGAAVETLGMGLIASAPLTSAVFLHFGAVFSRAGLSRRALAGLYALAAATVLVTLVLPAGRFAAYRDLGLVAKPNPLGLGSAVIWAALGLCGHLILLRAWWRARGLARKQIAAVAASSAWGLLCMSGYAVVAFDLPLYPWSLVLLPAYPLILVYAILRYRVLVANAWARRALAWTLLTGLACLMVALTPMFRAGDGLGARYLSAVLIGLMFLLLAGPARRLAERLVYPGGTVSAPDFAHWRASLAEAETLDDLAVRAAALLSRRLALTIAVRVGTAGAGEPAAPTLSVHAAAQGWEAVLSGWDAAPPGPQRVAALFGTVLADAADRVERASLLAARERERQTGARLAELGALAATVAHDIRNPLNVISMAAALSPPEAREEIAVQVGRISRLAQDLLDYAKPWRRDSWHPVALAPLLRELARHYPALRLEPDAPSLPDVAGDPARLRQALLNLLDNASALAPGTPIGLAAEADAATVRLHVCDNGPGVPEDIRPRLFEPFVSRSPGGTGLGLAIVARIAEAHGGSVALTERPGWITCFTLTLPVATLPVTTQAAA